MNWKADFFSIQSDASKKHKNSEKLKMIDDEIYLSSTHRNTEKVVHFFILLQFCVFFHFKNIKEKIIRI